MKWVRLLVLALALLVVAALVALAGPFRGRWEEGLRGLAARELGLALHTECSVEGLSVSIFPPSADVRGLRLGADGAIGSLRTARVALLPQTSLRQARPVLDVEADGVVLDLPALLDALPPPPVGPPSPVPRFRLHRVRVTDARVRVTGEPEPLVVTAPLVDGQLTADGLLGRLRFSARVAPVTIAHGPRTVALAQVEARGGEGDGGWVLRQALVRGDGITLDGTERDGALQIAGDLDLAKLSVVDDALASVHGAAHAEGSLTGTLDEPTIDATIHVPALAIDDRALGDVTATGSVDRAQVTVSSAQLTGFGGTAEGSGVIQLDEALNSTAKVTWTGLVLPDLIGPQATDVPTAALDGEADLKGTLTPLAIAATASGRVGVPGGAPPLQFKGDGRYADGGGSGVVEVTQGNGNVANANMSVARDGALAGTLRLRVADPDALAGLAMIQSLPNMRGALETTATIAGTVREPRFQGTVEGRDLMVVGVRVNAIGGSFAGDRSAVRSDGIRAALGGGTLTARGTVALDRVGQNTWTVAASGIDGDAVGGLIQGLSGARLPVAGGKVSLDASATGPWPRVRLTGTAHLDDFWLGRERIAQLAADVQAADGRWTADAHMRNRARQEVRVRASGRGDQDLDVALTCDAWSLTSLWQGEEAEMGGTLHARASLRGPARFLSGTATVGADDLVVGGRALGTVQVDVTADRGRWRASTNVLDDTLKLTAEVRPDPGLPFTVDGSWTDADAARLIGTQHGLAVMSSGTLHAGGRLDAVAQLDARVDITTLSMTGGAKPVTADVPLSIVCRRGLCQLDRLTLRGGKNSLRVSGEAGFDGRVRLTMSGDGTLSLLELIDQIESARGTFTVDATVTHGAAGWTALGTMNLDQVAIDAGLPVAVTRTGGRLVFDGNLIRVEELSGRIGSGTYSIGGSVDLRNGPALTWQLVDVGADPLPSLEVEAGGHGTLDGTWERLRVAGDVRINRLLYDRNIELTDFLPRFNRALAAAPRQTEGTVVELALTIDAPGELYVENNLTRMEARAHLTLTGTAAQPVLEGRIEALDGEVYLRGRTFDLLGATVDFRPDLGSAAALNISAESLIDTPDAAYVVGVRVTGTTVDPRVTLTSDDPSLSQTDIAALIAFGRTTAQMREGGGSFSISGALGNQIGSLLSGEAQKVLPVDRIDFEPTFSTTTGAFEPQLTIGKDITEDLSASVGQTFGVASRTRVEVTYRLGPRVSVLGSWESQTETEAGAFAGGLRLRYEFWHLTPYTLLGDLR